MMKVFGTLLALLMIAPMLATPITPIKSQAGQVPSSRQAVEDTTAGSSAKLNAVLQGWLDELSPRATTALVIGTGALIGALIDTIGARRVAASLRGPSHIEAHSDSVQKGVQGTWHIDASRSESMTPFLISVGAPRS